MRVSFAVPWEGMLLLGTTDTLYEGDPDEVGLTEEDVEQILAEAAVALDATAWYGATPCARPSPACAYYPGAGRTTANARRETVLLRGPKGCSRSPAAS